MGAANTINDAFASFEDDVAGAITAQTEIAATDTNWTQAVDTKFHVAMLATETAGGNESGLVLRLQYNLGGAGWNDVTTSTPIQAVAPTNCTTSDAASYGTTALTTGATIQATEYDTGGGDAASVNLSSSSKEYTTCLQIDSAQVTNGDTIQLRLTDAGNALDADTTIPTITVSEANTGTGSATLPAITTSAAGDITKTGSGSPSLPALTATGEGTAVGSITGTGTATLPAITTTGEGTTGVTVTGTGSVALPAITTSGTGEREVTGTGGATLPAFAMAGGSGGEALLDESGNELLDESGNTLTSESGGAGGGEGTITKTGTGAATLPALTTTGSGTIARDATGAVTLPALTATGSGDVQGAITGSGAITLPAIQASVAGEITKTGSGAVTLPAITASGIGALGGEVAGSGAAILPALTTSGSGTMARDATGAAILPAITASGSGAVTAVGGAPEPVRHSGGGYLPEDARKQLEQAERDKIKAEKAERDELERIYRRVVEGETEEETVAPPKSRRERKQVARVVRAMAQADPGLDGADLRLSRLERLIAELVRAEQEAAAQEDDDIAVLLLAA